MASIKTRLKALITLLGGEPVGETDGPLLTELEDAVKEGGSGGITPTGNVTLTENGEEIDVAEYATATVAVPGPTGTVSITENGENVDVSQYATATVAVTACVVSFDLNGGTGTVAPIAVVKGSVANLPGGSGITLPAGKTHLIGWALTSDSESVLANYKPTADATVYAIYGPRSDS